VCSGNIHELDNEKAKEYNAFIDSMAEQGPYHYKLWIFTLMWYFVFLNLINPLC
jgi:hypothetical protein